MEWIGDFEFKLRCVKSVCIMSNRFDYYRRWCDGAAVCFLFLAAPIGVGPFTHYTNTLTIMELALGALSRLGVINTQPRAWLGLLSRTAFFGPV